MTADGVQHSEESTFTYEIADGESSAIGIVKAVSTVSGTAPLPGAETDDALDSVFQMSDPDTEPHGQITFSYSGYEVTVYSDGRISVERPATVTGELAD